jgi:SAM-dependent methyltransferase
MINSEILTKVPFELLLLGAATKTGIIRVLEKKPMAPEELSMKIEANKQAVLIITEALTEINYLRREGDLLTLSEDLRNALYNPDSPNYIGFSFMHRYNMIRSWLYLPEIIESGQANDSNFASKDTVHYMAAMHQEAVNIAPSIAKILLNKEKEGLKILDIGGGPLTYAKAFSKYGAKVTVLDLECVVDSMIKSAQDFGIEMVPGDFNVRLPDGPYDLAFLSSVCHVYGELENIELFKKVYNILENGGKIAVADFIRGTNPFASIFGVNMLINTRNGDTYTLEQYIDWLESAGFSDFNINEIGVRRLITAIKK